jgi:hypothetical protein
VVVQIAAVVQQAGCFYGVILPLAVEQEVSWLVHALSGDASRLKSKWYVRTPCSRISLALLKRPEALEESRNWSKCGVKLTFR